MLVVPATAALRTTHLFEKSSAPVTKAIGGMRTSFTSELTIPPNAAPMITPTARSMALPLIANSLNSFHMWLIPSDDDDVDQLSWNDNHFANRLTSNPVLNFRVRQRDRFQFLLRSHDRHFHTVTKLAVYLNDDFNFVFD